MPMLLSEMLLTSRPHSPDCAILDIGPHRGVHLPRSNSPAFNYVLEGSVAIRILGNATANVILNPGDFAIFVRGSAYVLQVGDPRVIEHAAYFEERETNEQPPVHTLGEGGAARVLMGVYGSARAGIGDHLVMLPDLAVERAIVGPDGPQVPLWGDLPAFAAGCGGVGARASIFAMVHGFLVKMVREASANARIRSLDARSTGAAKVTMARLLIEGAPRHEWTASELAKRVGASRSVFFKAFLAETGRSPGQFLLDLRMRRATELLGGSRSPIGDIAWQVGYRSATAFSRTFKRETGMTPGEFRASAGGGSDQLPTSRPVGQATGQRR